MEKEIIECIEALHAYKQWCKEIKKKEIQQRNTEEEIAELDKHMIRILNANITRDKKWLELNS